MELEESELWDELLTCIYPNKSLKLIKALTHRIGYPQLKNSEYNFTDIVNHLYLSSMTVRVFVINSGYKIKKSYTVEEATLIVLNIEASLNVVERYKELRLHNQEKGSN
ncbi:MAG: hypothetical protein CFE21_19985 [Bacteroidetes bacterium B1(2017)]|nr:MAG: hypothetical protein CFE21_19985 [Bacteroidetes bacterium B1(2017)]